MFKKIVLSLIAIMGITASAFAQKQVTGKVVDAQGQALPGVSVYVAGANVGTVTDEKGAYALNVADGSEISFAFFGMKTVSVPVTGKSVIDVTMEDDVLTLNEAVVTALGITKSEKSLGYSATTVKSDEIKTAHMTNVANSLSGKVAGVQILTTSSDPGASSNIVIRGFSSIGGSNQPLYVVDGVPTQTTTVTSASGDKTTAVGGISNVAPEDIESMTILKGAAATALYGSRAANGVIVITTKSGKKGEERNFSLSYNGGMQIRQVATFPTMQNKWGQGWNGVQTYIENGSWGPAFDGSQQLFGPIYNFQQQSHPYSAVETNVKDFFDLGISQNHNLSFSGQSNDSKVTYYASYSYTDDNGIMPGDKDKYTRNTFAAKGSYQATKWLKVSSSFNFANVSSDVVDTDQGTSVIDGLYELPRDISIVDMKDLSNPFNTPAAYLTSYGITNPYWSLENNYDHTNSQQINGNFKIDINPIKQLTITYRYGFDYTNYDHKVGYPQIALDDALVTNNMGYAPSEMNQSGYVSASYGKKYETNHDFLVNYTDTWGKFDFTGIVGLNINERGSTAMGGTTSSLAIETGWWDLSNGSTRDALSESQSMRRLMGLFGDFTLGWDDQLYLDVTLRNDWSSTLPLGNNSFFYPGVTASWIFTKTAGLNENNAFSFGKLRVAYGKTGNDAGVYQTAAAFTQAYANGYYYSSIAQFPMNSTNSFIMGATKGSSTLRPEMTSEFEVGANLVFFKGRLALDATYYDRATTDQIFTLPVDPSTGYQYMITNFGKVTNKGVELLLSATPVRTRNWKWDISINWAKNNNKVVSLPDGLEGGKSILTRYSAGNDAVYIYAEVGKPLGQIYTYKPMYTEEGQPIVDKYGVPVVDTENLYDTGKNIQSDWTGGISTSLTWKGLTLSATLDCRKGGYMFSRTKNLMQFTGNGIATSYNDRNPFVVPNSVQAVTDDDGKVTGYVPNTTPITMVSGSYQNYFDESGAGQGGEFYLIDRSFVKLRNVTLTWALPKKWVKAITLSDINISAFCNNAFTWTAADNYYIDPETSTFAGSGDLVGQFGEMYSNPACRIWGFSVGLKF